MASDHPYIWFECRKKGGVQFKWKTSMNFSQSQLVTSIHIIQNTDQRGWSKSNAPDGTTCLDVNEFPWAMTLLSSGRWVPGGIYTTSLDSIYSLLSWGPSPFEMQETWSKNQTIRDIVEKEQKESVNKICNKQRNYSEFICSLEGLWLKHRHLLPKNFFQKKNKSRQCSPTFRVKIWAEAR